MAYSGLNEEFSNKGSQSKTTAIGAVIVFLVILILALAIGLGVGLNNNKSLGASGYPLPPCENGTLYILTRTDVVRGTGENPVVARCYDGYPWEPVTDLDFPPLVITCPPDADCYVETVGVFVISSVDVPEEILDQATEEQAARFLTQASFGGSKADIQAVASTVKKRQTQADFTSWVKSQMALPASLLRTYYRKRVNPRQTAAGQVGALYMPCERNSRYHRFALNIGDEDKQLVVSATEVPNMFTFRVNGVLRGETDNFLNTSWPAANITFPQNLTICNVPERIGGMISLSLPGGNCLVVQGTANPAISFTTPPAGYTQVVSGATMTPMTVAADAYIMTATPGVCTTLSPRDAFVSVGGVWYRYDPRLKLLTNTLESPSSTPAEGSCATAKATFLNEKIGCVKQSSCAPVSFSAASLTLNETNLRTWFLQNNRFVYYIRDLRLESPYLDSPCKAGKSRWSRLGPGACPAPTNLDALTLTTLRAALVAAGTFDTNPFVRDITVTGVNCTQTAASLGAQVAAGGECFQHVHPHWLDVRDMTQWTISHDGNAVFAALNLPNPIERWARNGLTYIQYQASHPMSRWSDKQAIFTRLGRWGDVISFSDLPTALQTAEMAASVGALVIGSDKSYEVCGSPGEAANDPMLGNMYQLPDPIILTDTKARGLDTQYNWGSGKNSIWLNTVLSAPDQLRHRVAWALAQIFTLSEVGVERGSENEPWAIYYDIFVRNAFGNYRDIMREVSFSPMMGGYLTYLYNTAFAWRNTYPDENYAREIMQLFSIGLWQLNDDYSQKLDDNGNPIATYTNEDILDMARLWTGMDFQTPRGNIEAAYGPTSSNIMDPMILHASWRDKFPKANLLGGFLGDRYPLCDSLPPTHWLTIGAEFEMTGNTSIDGPLVDAADPKGAGHWGRFEPPVGSALYQKLCAAPAAGQACTFPIRVKLDANLPCTGIECTAQRVTTVRIWDPVAKIQRFYTYDHIPCVRLSFFEDGKIVGIGSSRQCGNPKHKVAFPVCCYPQYPMWGIDSNATWLNPTKLCSYGNEAMDHATVAARCQANNWVMCNINYTGWTSWGRTCADAAHMWLNASCDLSIQVYPSGQIGIVDPSVTDKQFALFNKSSGNVFRVHWENGVFPDTANCAQDGCTLVTTPSGDSCVCPITTQVTVPFNEPAAPEPSTKRQVVDMASGWSPQDLLDKLFVGAADPATFPAGTYTQCTSEFCQARTDVTVWLKAGGDPLWDADTVFELAPLRAGGKKVFLANYLSTIWVGSRVSFRNPPHIMPLTGEQGWPWAQPTAEVNYLYESQLEIEAGLDHFFEHPNTAPFVVYRLIQRMVTSNPSPRYMKTCVEAFRTGYYNEEKYSGVYGDLGAAVACVVLDREARNDVLQADKTFGSLREPLVKVAHVLRALEYKTKGRGVSFPDLLNKIGMDVFQQPSVFGFYLPENRPAGPISDAGLVGPEVQIGTSPFVVGYLNGLTSLIDNGLTNCNNGFGWGGGVRNCRNKTTINQTNDGALTYQPAVGATADDIINELDLLLTSGRLNPATRDLIKEEYEMNLAKSGPDFALARAEKLFITTPEFHTTGGNILKNVTREEAPEIQSQGRPYKAIVVLFQNGGCDSYNMLVPLSGCGAKDLYAEYRNVRAEAALGPSELMPLNAAGSGQPCSGFGLHNSMPTMKGLYDDKDALFVANVGALVEPLTKQDYAGTSGVTKKFPPSLFAHNVMQRSMHNLDPNNLAAKGILGRAIEALERQADYKSDLYSLIGKVPILDGFQEPDYIDPWGGVPRFLQFAATRDAIGNITEFESESVFAETYSKLLAESLTKTESLGARLAAVTLNTTFGTDYVSRQLMQVAKLIKLRSELKTERAVFVTQNYGYDTHNTFNMSNLFGWIDTGMNSFVQEMKKQGIWDDIVVVTVSEFGRTLTPNNGGTDHAWAGNHFVAGGSVKGGRILGKYPDTLTDEGTFNIGRGRLLPSTSWEAIWNGVVQWFGVDGDHLPYVLPNAKNFPNGLFSVSDLFN